MPTSNLTRDEAAERARQISNAEYDVHLDLTTGEKEFRSVATIVVE